MLRSRSLMNALLSGVHYRNAGSMIISPHVPCRFVAVAAGSPAGIAMENAGTENTAEPQPEQDVEETGAPLRERRGEQRPLQFGTLQFLLQRRMPISSLRLLTNGIRLACDERRAETMVQYLGPWLAQLTRPEVLERIMPWSITMILRDVTRLSRVVGVQVVREALPPKHVQTLANRLVVQGFDKLTPLQLAQAAECFGLLRPWQKRPTFDQAALEGGVSDNAAVSFPVWPSSDWVDELVDWLHNLKPDAEPWERTSCYCLSTILYGLARSNYKPRQPTLQAAAVAMKAKFEEQLKTGYLSRQALLDSTQSWNIWRVNPEEHAPGYWDVYFKTAAQVMEEYVDSVPDPPSLEDGILETDVGESGVAEGSKRSPRRRFGPESLIWKRRTFRRLLATVVIAVDNFHLTKNFNEHAKAIWLQRLDEHTPYISGVNARYVLKAIDNTDISVKEQTREKLMEVASRYRRTQPAAPRDIDEFDDAKSGPAGGGARGRIRGAEWEDFDDVKGGGAMRSGTGGARRSEFGFDDKEF